MHFLVLILLLFSSPLIAKENLTSLQNGIERIIRNADPEVHIGVEVMSLKNGQKLYQKSSNHLFMPASCLKLFTGAVALHQLGVDYRFETKLFTDGKVEGKTLKGNLYLKGSGDPELNVRDLEELAFQLKLHNIQKIEGDLYIDNTLFDGLPQGPGWMWDEGAERWNSPMDALTLNHNCIDLWVKPSEKMGTPPLVYLFPKTDYVAIDNRAATTAQEDNLFVERRWMQKENVIDVKGKIAANKETRSYSIPIEDPPFFAAHIFRDILAKAGFALKGKIEIKETPKKATLLATHTSRPLSLIVEEMMKSSDNLIADCLFKKVGEARYGAPGTWQKGSQAMREFLAMNVGLNIEKMVMMDGSGLSRYNLISAHQFVEFLSWMHKQFTCCSEFVSALPISGVDGTLGGRMVNAGGKVRAKTGSMTGVSSLSGYLTTKDGETLAFSILQNGFTGKTAEYKAQIEDEICTFLANFSRER
jgi:D-alanyl-D-alanine carboxypeptidase/D-alanyl-D-alanine-endopeptidase (penicillin-binding protein 4)